MSFKNRIVIILTLLILCSSAFFVLGYFSLRRSVPPESGVFSLPGMVRPVEIGRDEWGVPHILAENEQDLYFAAGYSCAQDRLWEMDLIRRAAQGRLSEIFGKEFVPVDIFARTVGFGRLGRQLLSSLPPNSASNLNSYSAGINAYIITSRQLPLEFGTLHYQPDPWKPEESLACMRLVGWLLSMGWNVDLVYAEVAMKVDSLKFSRILPESLPGMQRARPAAADSTAPPPSLQPSSARNQPLRRRIIPPSAAPQLPSPQPGQPRRGPNAAVHISAELRQGEERLRLLFNSPAGGPGSNCWVINSRLSSRGEALLANDTHFPFTAPSVYYLMHLKSPQINAVGAAFPGLPGLVVGRNEQIAWGITNGMVDDIDFVPLQPDSADDDHYRFGGQRYSFTRYDETITVRDDNEQKIRVTWSHMGPLVSAETPLLGYHGSRRLVLRWTGFATDDPLTAFQKLLTAGGWRDFLAALETAKTPGENFFYADRSGQIGYKLAAAVPVRTYDDALVPPADLLVKPDSLVQSDSLMLREGRRRGEWLGSVPFEQLPQTFQPLSGWLANANNCVADTATSFYISSYWEPAYRWQRIKAAFDTTSRWDVQACRNLQADVYSGHAAFFVPRLLEAIKPLKLPESQPANFGRELLMVWDYQQSTSSVASTIYEVTLLEFMRLTFIDELGGELYRRFLQMPHVNIRALDRLIAEKDSLWFDDVRTPGLETLDDQLMAAFTQAIDSLTGRYSENPGMWSWGDVHTLTQRHPFGLYGPFRRFYNIGPSASAGGNFTLNNSTYDLSRPFATIIGPCVRQVVDMSTTEYHVILPAGQSGHPFSRHYRDQLTLWQQGRTMTLNLNALSRRNPGWQWQTLRPLSAIP